MNNQVIRKLARMNDFDNCVTMSKTKPLAYPLNGFYIIDEGNGTFRAFTPIHDNGTIRFRECELPIRQESLGHYRQWLVRRFLKIQDRREYSGYSLNKKRKRTIRKLNSLIKTHDNIIKCIDTASITISSLSFIDNFLKWLKKMLVYPIKTVGLILKNIKSFTTSISKVSGGEYGFSRPK